MAAICLCCGTGLIITNLKTKPSGAETDTNYSTGLAYSYNDTDLTATVTGPGACNDAHIMVPPTVTANGKTYRVTTIGSASFRRVNTFSEMTLPEGLTTIDDNAFYQCSVTKINLPQSLTRINALAFAGAKIQNLVFPAGLKMINNSYVCHAMEYLETVRFLGATEFNNAVNLFNHDSILREVYLPNTLTSFYVHMFGGDSKIETLVLGDKITSLPYDAFTEVENALSVAKIANIYYGGTPAQKTAISMPNGSDGVTNPAAAAHWYYYSATPNLGDSSGNEDWHSDSDGNVMLWRDSDIRQATVTGVEPTYTYTGDGIVPAVTVSKGEQVLTAGVDYLVTASNNVNAGTANYTVTGIGNYAGTITGNFTIVPQVIDRPAVDNTAYAYTGEPQTYQLAEHPAYTVSSNQTQTNAGQYSIIVSLKNTSNYVWDNQTTGNLTYLFKIARQAVAIPAVQSVDLDANDELLIETYYRSNWYDVQKIRSNDSSDPNNYLGQPVKNGSYRVMLTLTDRQNYCWQDGTDDVVTVAFAINVTYQPNQLTGAVQIDGWTYGDQANQPTGVTATYGMVGYYYTTDAEIAGRDEFNIKDWRPWFAQVPQNAGTYYVLAYVPATDAQNVAVHSTTIMVTVAPKPLTIKEVVMAVKTFDGTMAGSGQIAVDGVVAGDLVRVDGTFTWDSADAGTKDFSVTALTVDNANYLLSVTDYHGTDANGILWRTVMRPTPDERHFVYNARAQVYYVPQNDYYTVTDAAQTNAGDYTVMVALNDAVNYRWDDGSDDVLTFPFVIDRATLAVTVAMADFRVNDTATTPMVTATLNGTNVDDLPWVVIYAAADVLDAESSPELPTAIGHYRVTATLTDHPNFNDVSAVGYFQIYQLITAEDGLGSLVIAADGSYGLVLAASSATKVQDTTSVAYAMQITRDGTPIDLVGNLELQILVPPALQSLAEQDGTVAFDQLQKNLTIMVTAAEGTTQKVNQFTLVNRDGQVYAVFAYSGAGQTDVTFAYTVPVTSGFNWGIFVGSALAVAGVAIFVVALVLVLKMKKRKLSPALLK